MFKKNEKTEAQALPGGRRRPILWLMLVVLALPGILYLAYVLSQLEQGERESVRLLARAADRLEEILKESETTVRNLGGSFENVVQFGDRQPYLSAFSNQDRKTLEALQGWEERLAGQPRDLRPRIEVRTWFSTRDAELVLAARAGASEPQPATAFFGPKEFAFRVDLERILEQSPTDGAFDLLVLADGSGRTLAQVGFVAPFGDRSRGLRISNLDQLVVGGASTDGAQSGATIEFAELVRSSLVEKIRVAGDGYRIYCQPVTVDRVPATDDAFPAEEQEERDAGRRRLEPATWAYCGLVPTERAINHALAVSPLLAASLFLFLVLGFLSWPFVKLSLMDRRERFRFADATFLLISTCVSLMVLTVVLVDVDSYLGLTSKVDRTLEELAASVDSRLTRELGQLYEQLDLYDRQLGRLATPGGESDAGETSADWRDTELLLAPGQRTETQGAGGGRLPAADYPYFTSVFWMAPTGQQVAKATVRRHNTPPVNLDQREYFRAIRDGRTWELPGGEEFYFQTFGSVTTGERSTALSKRSAAAPPAGDEAGRPAVAAISSVPLSVMEPVLPPGYDFAVIDDAGESLFHSVPSKALQENLFDTLGNHRRLRAAMASRTARTFGSMYLGRPYQVHVRPMRAVPWFAVALYDEEVSKTANLEALGTTAVMVHLYLVAAVLLCGTIYLAIRTRRGATWLWPDAQKRLLYQRIFGTGMVILAVSVVLLRQWDGIRLLWLGLAVPLAMLIVCLGQYLYWDVEGGLGERVRRRVKWAGRFFRDDQEVTAGLMRWHLAAVLVLWILVAVLPAVAFFKAAWQDQMDLLRKHEGAHLVAEMEQRHNRLREEYEDVPRPAGFFGQRLEEESDVYTPSVFGSRVCLVPPADRDDPSAEPGGPAAAAEDPRPKAGACDDAALAQAAEAAGGLPLGDLLSGGLPIYNQTAGRLRYLRPATADDGSRAWWRRSGDEILLVPDDAEAGGTLWIESPARPGLRIAGVAGAGGVLLLGLLWVWNRYSAYRLFFAKIHSQVEGGGYRIERLDEITRPVIALVASPGDRKQLAARGERPVVDLEGRDRETAERLVAGLEPNGGRQVVCVNFEADLENAETRDWKLRMLERLVFDLERKVILPSAFNPLEDLFWFRRVTAPGAGAATGAGAPTAAIQLTADRAHRWGRLLSEFVVVPIAAGAPPSDDADFQIVSRGLPRRLGRREEEIERKIEVFEGYYWALWTACSPDEQLVLVHLAQEKFVNPKQAQTVRRLLQRGLVRRDPWLRLMDDAFERFVVRTHEPLEVAQWERAGHGLGWQQLRWAFLSLLIVVALFLFATQQELFDATVGFVSALVVGGIPAIVELVRRFGRGGARAAGG